MAQQYQVGKVATSVFTDDDGYTKIIYHNTPVVTFNEDEIILDTGGWFTHTTKTRMNQASNQYRLGYQVYQDDFTWYINYQDETITWNCGNRITLKR